MTRFEKRERPTLTVFKAAAGTPWSARRFRAGSRCQREREPVSGGDQAAKLMAVRGLAALEPAYGLRFLGFRQLS
jgi:hypothetical protein